MQLFQLQHMIVHVSWATVWQSSHVNHSCFWNFGSLGPPGSSSSTVPTTFFFSSWFLCSSGRDGLNGCGAKRNLTPLNFSSPCHLSFSGRRILNDENTAQDRASSFLRKSTKARNRVMFHVSWRCVTKPWKTQ